MNKLKTIIALLLVVFIPFGLMIWMRIHQTTGFASTELILYPLLFGGLSIVVLYLLKRFYLKEKLKDFNSGKGNIGTDILWGIALTAVYFILFFAERATLSNILSFNSNMELLGLMLDMRKSPIMLILWFGPVLWIGIALYEELIRVFILDSLWKFSQDKIWAVFVIILASVLIGLTHWSQGSYGIVTIALKSIVACFFFYKVQRLFPLVLAHVLYDGLQVAMILLTYPN